MASGLVLATKARVEIQQQLYQKTVVKCTQDIFDIVAKMDCVQSQFENAWVIQSFIASELTFYCYKLKLASGSKSLRLVLWTVDRRVGP